MRAVIELVPPARRAPLPPESGEKESDARRRAILESESNLVCILALRRASSFVQITREVHHYQMIKAAPLKQEKEARCSSRVARARRGKRGRAAAPERRM
jgi:hypothetical protein